MSPEDCAKIADEMVAGAANPEAAADCAAIAERIRAAAPKWTTDRPKASGFYWLLDAGGIQVVEVKSMFDSWLEQCLPGTRWCGPINPPEVPT